MAQHNQQPFSSPLRRPHRLRRGMTLIEITVSLLVLAVAIGATLGTLSSITVLTDSSWERATAYTAGQRFLEELRAEPLSEVFSKYSTDPDFTVGGLNPQPEDLDGFVGRVILPVSEVDPTGLYENLDAPDFGFPRDLNGDRVIDSLNHASDYAVLPIRIRIEWSGRSGNSAIEVQTILRKL